MKMLPPRSPVVSNRARGPGTGSAGCCIPGLLLRCAPGGCSSATRVRSALLVRQRQSRCSVAAESAAPERRPLSPSPPPLLSVSVSFLPTRAPFPPSVPSYAPFLHPPPRSLLSPPPRPILPFPAVSFPSSPPLALVSSPNPFGPFSLPCSPSSLPPALQLLQVFLEIGRSVARPGARDRPRMAYTSGFLVCAHHRVQYRSKFRSEWLSWRRLFTHLSELKNNS